MKKQRSIFLGIRTRNRRMVGADDPMELWRYANLICTDSNCEDGVFNSNLYLQLVVSSIYNAYIGQNSYAKLKHFQLKYNRCICNCNECN